MKDDRKVNKKDFRGRFKHYLRITFILIVIGLFITSVTIKSRTTEYKATGCYNSKTSTLVQRKWKFISFPDFFNFNVPNPNPKWDVAVDWVLDQIKSENHDFVMIAGDLVNGHWWDSPIQLEHLSNVYYGEWLRRMKDHNLKYYVSVGDHELGDGNWSNDFSRIQVGLFDAVLYYYMGKNIPSCAFKSRCNSYMVVEYTGDIYPMIFIFIQSGK